MKRNFKRGILALSLLVSLFILVGCLKAFSLELPDNVTASVGVIDSINARTEIILTVEVPEDHELEELLVNGVAVNVVNNIYKFVINEDTVVNVSFRALEIDYYSLSLPDYIISDQLDNEKIREGTAVILGINLPVGKRLDNLYINGVEVFYNNNIIKHTILEDTIIEGNLVDSDLIKYFTLTLPEHVTANVLDLLKVAENEEVILTFNIPSNKKLDGFKINGIPIPLAEIKNNTFKNKMLFNVVISIELIDADEVIEGWHKPNVEDVIYLYNNFNATLFKEGIIDFSVLNKSSYYSDLINVTLNLNDKLDIMKGNLAINNYRYDSLHNVESIYSDGKNIYIRSIYYNEDGTTRYDDRETYIVSLESQMIELFSKILIYGGQDEISKLMPSGPHSFNDVFKGLFEYLIVELPDGGDIIEDLDVMRKDDLYRIKISLDKEDIIKLGTDFLKLSSSDFNDIDENLIFDIVLDIVDNELVKLTITNDNGVVLDNIDLLTITIEYNNKVIIEPEDLSIYGPVSEDALNYHFHLDENNITNFTIEKELMVDMINGSNTFVEELIQHTGFYRKGYKMVGIYLDNKFTNKVSSNDLLEDNLDIYVKWEKVKSAEELLNEFLASNFIQIKDNYMGTTYYEDNKYIIITKERDTTYRIIDKINNKQYEGYSSGGVYNTYEITNTMFVINSLKQDLIDYDLEDVITINNVYYNFKNEVTMYENKLLLSNANKYGLDNGVFEVLAQDPIITDVDAYVSSRIVNVMMDEIINIELNTYFDIIDINNFETELMFRVIYSSGLREYVSLNVLKNKEQVTYEMPKDTSVGELTLYYGDDELTITTNYYDSKEGTVIIVDGEVEYYYLKNMGMLPVIDVEYDNMFFDGFLLDGKHNINTFQELQLYANGKVLVTLTPNYKMKDFEDIIENLTSTNIVLIEEYNYGAYLYYNVEKELLILREYDREVTIRFTDTHITLYDNEFYLRITKEQYIQDRKIVNRMFQNLHNYSELLELELVIDAIKGNLAVVSETKNAYILENGIILEINDDEVRLIGRRYYYNVSEYNLEYDFMEEPSYIYNFEYNSEFFTESFKYSANNLYYIDNFDFDVKGKLLSGLHFYKIDGTPNLKEVINNNNIEGSNKIISIYANYIDVPAISDVLARFKVPTKYIIKSYYNHGHEMRIYRGVRIEIYRYGALSHLIDLENDITYYVSNNSLYEIANEEVLNLIDFINSFDEDDFIYNNNSKDYSVSNYINNKHQSFRVSVISDYISLYYRSNELVIDEQMIYIAEDFDLIDISIYEKKAEDSIEEIGLLNRYGPYSINNLDRLGFQLFFESGRVKEYSYNEIIKDYEINVVFDYDESYIELTKNGIIATLKFSDYNVGVYDETIDVIIVLNDKREFYYLSDLTELPISKDDEYRYYVGWHDQYDNVVDIQYIRDFYQVGEIVHLYEISEYHTINSSFNYYMNSKRNIQFQDNRYFNLIYDIENDAFIYNDYYYYYNLIIIFKDGNVIISSNNESFELPLRDIMIASNSDLLNNLKSYYRDLIGDIEYISKLYEVIKGDVLIPKNNDDQMVLDNGLLVTNMHSGLRFEFGNIYSNIYTSGHDSVLDYIYNYNYNVIIENEITNDVINISLNNIGMLENFELGFHGYVFVGFYDSDNNKVNLIDLPVGNTVLTAKYEHISEVDTYFNNVRNNEQYILISQGIEYRIIKGEQIEVYIGGELKYVKLFDGENNLTYELYNNEYYVTDLNDEVFDFVTYFDSLLMSDFELSRRNLYEHANNNEFVTFLVDPQRNGYHILSPHFEGHMFFEFAGTEFELTDISNIIVTDEITNVKIKSYNRFLSKDELYENIYYEVNFASGRVKHYTIYKFNEVYNAKYEFRLDGSFVTYLNDGILETKSFSAFGIYVFDYNLSSVVYFEKLDTYHYLANIIILPKLDETISSVFAGWYYDRYGAIVNIDFLNSSTNKGIYIHLSPRYSTKATSDILNSFTENKTVNFVYSSNSFVTQYDFVTDTFTNIKNGVVLSKVTIDGNNVTISSQYGKTTLTIDQFRSENNYNYLSEILNLDYVNYFVPSMLNFRDVIMGNSQVLHESQRIIEFENEVKIYAEIEYLNIYDRSGYEFNILLKEKSQLELAQFTYDYNILIKNDINEDEFLVQVKDPYIINYNYFNYIDYVFNGYYSEDDMGNIDYDSDVSFYYLNKEEINIIYASYDNLIYPEEFLADFINSEKYVASSYEYTFYIHQNNQIDIHRYGAIKYIVTYEDDIITKYELINGRWYLLLDDTLEFNFTNIFKDLKNEDFELNNVSDFYQRTIIKENEVDFRVNPHNSNIEIYHRYFSNIFDNSYSLEIIDFVLEDINKIEVTEDVIIDITMNKIELDSIANTKQKQYFIIQYQSGRSTEALLETLINNFDILVSEHKYGISIVINYLDNVYEFEMAAYNTEFDVVIIFEELQQFVYLDDLVKLPEYEDRYGDIYRNWFDQETNTNATIASLKRNDGDQEIIRLSAR